MQLIEALIWRYATKRMNGKKVRRSKKELIFNLTE